jgi:hypothetical protein
VSRPQSSRLAEFGGRGMSFNICRGTLGSLAMFTAIRNASSRDGRLAEHLISQERAAPISNARIVEEVIAAFECCAATVRTKHNKCGCGKRCGMHGTFHEQAELAKNKLILW